jgi:CheY-like chemotaxis protein
MSSRSQQQPISAVDLAPRILVAEDDDEMRRLLAWSLMQEGYEVTECADGIEFLDRLGRFLLPGVPVTYDLIITDVRMPGVDALEALQAVEGAGPLPPLILISAFGDQATHHQAERLGVLAFFDKPFELDELISLVLDVAPRPRLVIRRQSDSEPP